MITLNGVVIFKMFLLNVLNEMYIQKKLSPQVQNTNIDINYKFAWIKNCANIINHNIAAVLDLFDFCILLFQKFSHCHRQIFINKRLKAQAFNYCTTDDLKSGFSRKKFIKFIKHVIKYHENDRLLAFSNEIIDLMQKVENIQRSACEENLIIKFKDVQQFVNIFSYLKLQFKFNDETIAKNTSSYTYVYASCTSENILNYTVTQK